MLALVLKKMLMVGMLMGILLERKQRKRSKRFLVWQETRQEKRA